jgi:hypothetical protein
MTSRDANVVFQGSSAAINSGVISDASDRARHDVDDTNCRGSAWTARTSMQKTTGTERREPRSTNIGDDITNDVDNSSYFL